MYAILTKGPTARKFTVNAMTTESGAFEANSIQVNPSGPCETRMPKKVMMVAMMQTLIPVMTSARLTPERERGIWGTIRSTRGFATKMRMASAIQNMRGYSYNMLERSIPGEPDCRRSPLNVTMQDDMKSTMSVWKTMRSFPEVGTGISPRRQRR